MWILGIGRVLVTIFILFSLFALIRLLVDDNTPKTNRIISLLEIIFNALTVMYIWT